ncbi:polyphenol oxidase family protein [Glaciecola sp. SC05]|uniref:polyphenol oxidase family protein n=1 Tax=Glaciecola sp. SC05 TaxID=1987355 RepID=UPI003529540B
MKFIVPDRPLAENLLCFTTTRNGGVSAKPYDSLNLAQHVSDNPISVERNRQLLSDYLNRSATQKRSLDGQINMSSPLMHSKEPAIAPLRFMKQTHSTIAIDYEQLLESHTNADAVFTKQSRVPLAVLTADCLPLVLFSNASNECAAVHAGWKGLIGGVIENAVDMFSADNSTISAWIGPSICQHHFEVGSDLAIKFKAYESSIVRAADTNKWHIDLSAVANQILQDLNIVDVQQSRVCTYCRDDLFSFRQSTHAGLIECGRMATIVMKY